MTPALFMIVSASGGQGLRWVVTLVFEIFEEWLWL